MKRFFVLLFSLVLVLYVVCAEAGTEKWKCPKCDNAASGKFCSKCGTKKPADAVIVTPALQPVSTPVPTPTPAPQPTSTPIPTLQPSYSPIPAESPTPVPTNAPTVATVSNPSENWLSKYGYDSENAVIIPADLLYEYGNAYVGKTVVTAMKVESKATRSLKTNTDNNTTYSYSIVADFQDKSEINAINEGDSVIVVGVVDEFNSISFLGSGNTVHLLNSHIITGDVTFAYIESFRGAQDQNSKNIIAAAEKQAADAFEQEKQNFIQSCEIVNYSDVERYPEQYKGMNVQVSGTVIQVSEGWFNSLTLRVKQSDGNIWYVSYTRSDGEPRIVENDKLIFYGECTGVETYTTIVRSQVTIPAMKAKYYQ